MLPPLGGSGATHESSTLACVHSCHVQVRRLRLVVLLLPRHLLLASSLYHVKSAVMASELAADLLDTDAPMLAQLLLGSSHHDDDRLAVHSHLGVDAALAVAAAIAEVVHGASQWRNLDPERSQS